MNDIVGVFNSYADSLDWNFTYGNKENQNLMQSDMEDGLIYFLLDPVTRNVLTSPYGGRGATEFTGSFMLVVKSDLDNTYNGTSTKVGKYEKNINPLLTKLELIKDIIECDNYTIENWSVVDVINALDVNLDGIIVTYKISKL